MKSLGSLIRSARIENDMLLRHLSAKLDMDTGLLSKIERGERIANLKQLKKIAKILKLDINELQLIWLADQFYVLAAQHEQGVGALQLATKHLKKNNRLHHA